MRRKQPAGPAIRLPLGMRDYLPAQAGERRGVAEACLQVFERWGGENLERDVLPQLARDGELYMHRHQGFFKSMDSFKEQQELEELVHSGHKPWLG